LLHFFFSKNKKYIKIRAVSDTVSPSLGQKSRLRCPPLPPPDALRRSAARVGLLQEASE
jgi:hypothetical protein